MGGAYVVSDSPSQTTIQTQFRSVQQRIEAAAIAAKREPNSVLLIAVSKLHPVSAIEALRAIGHSDFGENYVQEWSEKQTQLAHDHGLRWHLIGHLQTNKAKLVAPLAAMVQSVDSLKIAQALDRHAGARSAPLPVLVQVNVGDEEQKSGCSPQELSSILDGVAKCSNLVLRGLMTIPPVTENPADSMRYFTALVALRDRFGGAARLPELSMGMTHDLDYAISAGATMVRVGTAIFGSRTTPL